MKLYFVRHGVTEWNINHIRQGRSDIPLTDKGREQAKETGLALKDKHLDICICSPLSRTRETASIILEGRDVPVILDERVLERNFGPLEGMRIDATPEALEQQYRFWNPLEHETYEGVETMEELIARINAFLDDIKVKYADKSVLIVAHGGLSPAVKYYCWGKKPDGEYRKNILNNCEIFEAEI